MQTCAHPPTTEKYIYADPQPDDADPLSAVTSGARPSAPARRLSKVSSARSDYMLRWLFPGHSVDPTVVFTVFALRRSIHKLRNAAACSDDLADPLP